jgi:hypothetical protein
MYSSIGRRYETVSLEIEALGSTLWSNIARNTEINSEKRKR